MQVVVDSLLISYNRLGKGKKIILCLHGWGDSQASFTPLAEQLADSYAIVTVDLPGFGASQIPKNPWNLNSYSLFLAKFLDKLAIGRLFAIVGHSNGGAIAIYGLATGQLQADKLVLLASAGIRAGSAQSLHRKLWNAAAKFGKVVTAPMPKTAKTALRRRLYSAAGSDMLVVESMQETFKRVVQQDVQQEARQVRIPALLLYGSRDTSTPPSYGRTLEQQMQLGTFVLLPDAGHFVHHDQPQVVAKQIKEFLAA